MEHIIPTGLFLALTGALLWLIFFGVRAAGVISGCSANQAKKQAIWAMSFLATWLVLLAGLALWGFFANFDTIPPRLLLALLPPLIAIPCIIYLPIRPITLLVMPLAWAALIQTFRLVVEIILWLLYNQNAIPMQMTFEGLNIDILIGITAPLAARVCYKPNRARLYIARLWNIAGLLTLTNIVIIAVISTPSPLIRFFMNDPANTIVGTFPYIWLPGFMVPLAAFAHIISLKQIKSLRQQLSKK